MSNPVTVISQFDSKTAAYKDRSKEKGRTGKRINISFKLEEGGAESSRGRKGWAFIGIQGKE